MPTLVTSYYVPSVGTSASALVTPSFTPADGEVIICKLETWDTATSMSAPTGGLSFGTAKAIVAPGGFRPWVGIYAMQVGTSPGSVTVSSTPSAAARCSMVVERWSSASLAGSPVTGVNNAGTGAANATLTTSAPASVVSWVASDAQSVDPATRAYLNSATDEGVRDDHVGANGVGYHAYQPTAAQGSTTFGLSAPTGMQYDMAGIEVLASGGTVAVEGPPPATWWPGLGPWGAEQFVADNPGSFTAPSTTTPVSSDLDLRWVVSNVVTSDLDLRWRVANVVSQDLDARWRVYNQISSDLDARWRVANRVNSDLDLRWRVANLVSSDADLRWRVFNVVTSDLDARWRVYNALSNDLDLRWIVRNAVSQNLDLRWIVRNAVSSDLDARWRVANVVSQDLDARWRVRNAVSQDADIRWRVFNAVSSDADLRWRVYNAVSADADLRWRVRNLVSSDVDLRWIVNSTVVTITSDLDLRWRTRALVSSDLDARWRVFNTVAQDLDVRWRVYNVVQSTLDARWRVYVAVSADAALLWRVRELVSADLELLWTTATPELPTLPLPADGATSWVAQHGAVLEPSGRVAYLEPSGFVVYLRP